MEEIIINPKINILIVDDRYENLLALEGVLDNPDLNIIKAMSGNEALAKLVENDFALVLLDVQMPDMDGFETAKLMRGIEKTKFIPIIFVTAISKEQKYVFKGYESGAVDYIFKPIDADILKSKVKIFVDLFKKKKELEEMNIELSTLYKLSSAISKTIDFDKLTNSIVEVIIKNKLLNVLNKAIFFTVEDDKLTMKSYYGVSDELTRLHNSVKIGECLCGIAAQTGEIIISGNSTADPRHTINIELPHGHIILPVNDSKGICGVVCLYTPINIKIGERKIQLLKTICTQLGIAIEKSKLYEKTKTLALHDELTGLANRRLMNIFMEKIFDTAEKYNRIFSILMLDIDHFKNFNDTFGHQKGDELLTSISNILLKSTKTADLCVRFGGEEFLILLSETNMESSKETAERIRQTVEKETKVTISIGISTYNPKYKTIEEIISKADTALYKAKERGRNQVVIDE